MRAHSGKNKFPESEPLGSVEIIASQSIGAAREKTDLFGECIHSEAEFLLNLVKHHVVIPVFEIVQLVTVGKPRHGDCTRRVRARQHVTPMVDVQSVCGSRCMEHHLVEK